MWPLASDPESRQGGQLGKEGFGAFEPTGFELKWQKHLKGGQLNPRAPNAPPPSSPVGLGGQLSQPPWSGVLVCLGPVWFRASSSL